MRNVPGTLLRSAPRSGSMLNRAVGAAVHAVEGAS
jgi:hypothetical protein